MKGLLTKDFLTIKKKYGLENGYSTLRTSFSFSRFLP